jgi:hypothetical protein
MELMQASFDDAFPDIPLLEFRFRDLPDPPSAAWFLNPIFRPSEAHPILNP